MTPKQLSLKIKNNLIVEISESKGFSEIIIDNKKYTFENSYILPGLAESHCHIWGLGMILHDPNLIGLKSIDDCLDEIKKHSPNKAEWYYGRGWNHELWHEQIYPNKYDLDKILPDNPAFFFRIDGHTAWVNSKALEIAKIDKFTPNPEGGEIIKDEFGEPTGILIDNAMNLVSSLMPDYSDKRLEQMIIDALQKYSECGVTEIHDLDAPPQYVYKYIELDNKGLLNQRVKAYVTAQNGEYKKYNLLPYKGKNYEIVGLKFFVDGALGSRGAALIQDYSDDIGNKGLILIDKEDLYSKICSGIEEGFEISTHAIGDEANSLILDIYEKVRNKYGCSPILRIEHAQILDNNDIKRISDLKILLAVQSIHCVSDAEMAIKRLGFERCGTRAYLWKSLLVGGIKIMGGSDSPIEPYNPFIGIDAYVNRKSIRTGEPFFNHETISLEQAINSYSKYTYENFNNHSYGKIELGLPADFIIIDNDLKENISDTKVLMTVSDGKIIHQLN